MNADSRRPAADVQIGSASLPFGAFPLTGARARLEPRRLLLAIAIWPAFEADAPRTANFLLSKKGLSEAYHDHDLRRNRLVWSAGYPSVGRFQAQSEEPRGTAAAAAAAATTTTTAEKTKSSALFDCSETWNSRLRLQGTSAMCTSVCGRL